MENKRKKRKNFKKKLLELLDSSSELSEEESVSPPPRQRRRIIIDDDSDEENTPPSSQRTIAPSLLQKIGHIQKNENSFSLHGDIKQIWEEVLQKGLTKETKDSINKEIPRIKNCFTAAPTLNPEIKVTLTSQATKRDEHLCDKQDQIGASICGLSHILQEMIDGKTFDDTKIENMSNYIRLLCDVHYMESQTRRAVILPGLNKNLKDSLEKSDINENLFGKNLSDIIREARTLEKSKKDLAKERPLNNWGPSGAARKQGGRLNYKQPPYQPPAKQSNFKRQQHRQQFRSMVKPKEKETPYAPTDHRRRRV